MNRFTYTRVGAYWIPELKLMERSLHPIGKLMPKLARDASATERLKASDPMAWVRRMNALKDQVRKSSAKH